ncbi:uncharacterized protein [Periplaneta americana]|uniref:uncharacterized protein n=1 Tax=Periplaneta americana TaxID=6978 RepID=UPI0037E93C4A
MELRAYPDRLSNLAVDALGTYVSDLLVQLVTFPQYTERQNAKQLYVQHTCARLHDFLWSALPVSSANETTVKLLRCLHHTYSAISVTPYKSSCEEIAPELLAAILHPAVMRLECTDLTSHPTVIDYYKIDCCDLIYKSLPKLKRLKTLNLGWSNKFGMQDLKIDNAQNLEQFSYRHCNISHIKSLSKSCRSLKSLVITASGWITDEIVSSLLKFQQLENLVLENECVTQTYLTKILCGLSQSQEGSNRSLLLKSFGCRNPTDVHIDLLVERFRNVSSISLSNVQDCSLTPLKGLKHLKKFTLKYSRFFVVDNLLRAIGQQIECLDFTDIYAIDLGAVGESCPFLLCFHLRCFEKPAALPLPDKCSFTEYSDRYSLPEFSSERNLELALNDDCLTEYIMSRFTYVRKLYLSSRGSEAFLQTVLKRKHLKYLEQFFWGDHTIVTFTEQRAVIRKFEGRRISMCSLET